MKVLSTVPSCPGHGDGRAATSILPTPFEDVEGERNLQVATPKNFIKLVNSVV
jgi:hypothetical protein